MKKNKKNSGFTLIELLAVIIVLGIVMVIGAQNVIKTLNTARQKGFQDMAIKVAQAATKYVAENQVTGTALVDNKGLGATELDLGDIGNYQVCVLYKPGNTTAQPYTLTLYMATKDKTFCYYSLDSKNKATGTVNITNGTVPSTAKVLAGSACKYSTITLNDDGTGCTAS